MIDATWLLFTVASLALIATPGQDMILVMSRSVAQGAAAGVVTAAGVSVGLLGHTVLATLGLGAILRTSEWLFVALKFVGAAYLLYLGIGLLRYQERCPCHWVGRSAALGQALSGRCSLQSVQSQSGNFLLRFPAPVRFAFGATPNAYGICSRDCVRRAYFPRQGACRNFFGRAVCLVADPSQRAYLDLSLLRRHSCGSRRETGA